MEPMLAGLPCVVNADHWAPVAELSDGACVLVEKSAAGFRDAIRRLIDDDVFRAQQGRRAAGFARQRWGPAEAEARQADVYRRILHSY
jgi:hypothetical protein